MTRWIEACAVDDVDREDVIPVEVDGRQLAVYRSPGDEFHATDGYCTHQQFLLADGFVMGTIIECPKHNGRFDYTTGAGQGAPICDDLVTYPVRVDQGSVLVNVGRVDPAGGEQQT